MNLSLVVAMDRNRLIGAGNGLPWHLPADLKHFKKTTMGHPMVMGRLTWESIGRALPGRTSIVVTRRSEYEAPGAIVVDSIEAAKRAAGDCDELMIIGGSQVFEQALAEAGRIYLTEIHAELTGDVYFPEINPDEWVCVARDDFERDERNPYDYSFLVLERVPQALPAPLIQPSL